MFLNNCTVCVFLCVQMLVFWRKWCDKTSYLILFVTLQAKRKGNTDREVDEDIFLICFSRLVFK